MQIRDKPLEYVLVPQNIRSKKKYKFFKISY